MPLTIPTAELDDEGVDLEFDEADAVQGSGESLSMNLCVVRQNSTSSTSESHNCDCIRVFRARHWNRWRFF